MTYEEFHKKVEDGIGFTATYHGGIECKGHIRVSRDGFYYFCQDQRDGAFCADKFGHRFSYMIAEDNFNEFDNLCLFDGDYMDPRKLINTTRGYYRKGVSI